MVNCSGQCDRNTTIREVAIADAHWQRKHIGSIEDSYRHAPFFNMFEKGLRPILAEERANLCELEMCGDQLDVWLPGNPMQTSSRIRAKGLRGER